MSIPFSSLYTASKFALEGLSESAAQKLRPFGIKVKVVQPGFIHTSFGENMDMIDTTTGSEYSKPMEGFMGSMGAMAAKGSHVEPIAKVVFEAVVDTTDKFRFPAGDDAFPVLQERAAGNR